MIRRAPVGRVQQRVERGRERERGRQAANEVEIGELYRFLNRTATISPSHIKSPSFG